MHVLMMKTIFSLMLPEIGMLILLVVIAVCLILLTLTLKKIWEAFLQVGEKKSGGTPPITINGENHDPKHCKDYYEKIVKAEKAYFVKYVNRGDGTYRTVTFSNAVIQAFRAYYGLKSLTGKELRDALVAIRRDGAKLAESANQTHDKAGNDEKATDNAPLKIVKAAVTKDEFIVPDYNTDDCLIYDLDIEALESNVSEYVAYTSSLVGANVGAICLCPDGVNVCNWSSEMFEAFMVDTNVWNVVSVQIFHVDGTLISTSSINAVESSPSGQHLLITMSNQAGLNALPGDKEIRIVFKWLDQNDVLRCIVMKNVIPKD